MTDKVQAKIYAQMSFARKWEEVCRLRETARILKTAGVRSLHPSWSDQEVEAEVRKIFLYATTSGSSRGGVVIKDIARRLNRRIQPPRASVERTGSRAFTTPMFSIRSAIWLGE